jgi:hypothetical protein
MVPFIASQHLLLPVICSWSSSWGLNGSFKIAYGAAYVMQPDYTFALQVEQRAAAIQKSLSTALAYFNAKPGCLLYQPKQRQHLIKLADDLTTLASSKSPPGHVINQPDLLSDIVTSNLGYVLSLSVASKGPFKLCGKTAQLGTPANCEH